MRRSTLGILPCLALSLLLASGTIDAQPSRVASGPLASGLSALAASDYAKAESELARVKGALEPEAKLGLARAALEQGKYADAEKYVQLAASSQATKSKAGILRAELLIAQGKLKEALALLETLKSGKTAEARRARLYLGEVLIAQGKRAEADEPLKKIIEDYNDDTITQTDAEGLAMVGRAAFLLRSPKDANAAFKESERADKKRVETLLWEAELFLDKYDPGHATDVTKEALAIAPKRADALVMMARVRLEQSLDFDEADKLVKEALAIHPRHPGAFAVRAGLSLRDMDIQGTEKAIADGLASKPNDLELLSLKAAARFLDDDPRGFEAQKKEVLAQNPSFSTFYGIVGEFAEWEHRYDDIVAMMKEATKLDPDDAKSWALLGLTQMRGGDEDKGLEAIKKAWSKDKFNVRVFNTLNMYEQQIPTAYEMLSDGIFKVRYAKDERPVMERYVPRMLGEAWASMKARYGFVPKVPVQVELYASREQFSVRTSGLPNIGIQGVCFGSMIAAISPNAEPFNWGNVVWHELGHVFAIQLSKNHVPRWFTEGLSEYETIARRPEWARELDPALYQAITQNKLPGAVDMNRAFTHANDASDVTTAYYAASQMLIWTVERFGMKGVVKALELWGQGKKTPEVIKTAFGVTPEQYDKGYREWQLARLSRYKNQYLFTRRPGDLDDAKKAVKDRPNDADAHVGLALALLQSRKPSEAKAELEAALTIDPKHADAHFISARLALGQKDVPRAEKHLDAMRANGNDGFTVQMRLADVAEAKEDRAKLRFHLEAAYRFDPSQIEPLQGLFDLVHEAKDPSPTKEGDELDLLRKLTQLEQHDKKIWRMYLERLVALKSWDEARRVGESAVFVDVMGGSTHVLYARALAAQNAHEQAVFELETALLLPMKDKDKASVHGLLAQSLAATKQNAEATKHRDQALKLDPENAEAKAVKLP
ncbi:MAG TPA: tetratricopeptide repeat protein [Labilithrix sp.]|nr:tetratricopeptide repeat protein [Labilithrix sp.]